MAAFLAAARQSFGRFKVVCGWPLHCKRFSAISQRFVSTVVCPTCSRGDLPLALMISASEVPIGFTTSRGHCHSRSVLCGWRLHCKDKMR